MMGCQGLMAESVSALSADNVRYCKCSFSENAMTDRGTVAAIMDGLHIVKEKEILMCICTVLWEKRLFLLLLS